MIKVYFEDNKLNKKDVYYLCEKNKGDYLKVDAKDGFSSNLNEISMYRIFDNNIYLYTNSLVALNTQLCWNEEENKCECYFRSNNGWMNIQDILGKKIKKEMNIEIMYRDCLLFYISGDYAMKDFHFSDVMKKEIEKNKEMQNPKNCRVCEYYDSCDKAFCGTPCSYKKEIEDKKN